MNPSREINNELSEIKDAIKRGNRIINLSGLTSIAAKSYILSELQRQSEKTFVIITSTNKELENWECDLDFFGDDSSILTLPSFETDVYSGISPHAETQERRALALWNLAHSKPEFLVVSAKSLITKTPSPEEIKNLGANLKLDEDFAPEDLIELIESCGYVREEPIKSVGEFSVRGGILDVWSPTSENPVRIEFFGDTVDSIREFDAETQLSINQIKEVSIAPMREFAAAAKDFKDWAFFAKEIFNDEKFARNLKDRTDFASEGETFSGWEFLTSLTNPKNNSVFDFLSDCIFIIDEPPFVEQTLENYYEEIENHYAEITNHGEIGLEPEKLFLSGETLRESLNLKQRLELRALGKAAAETDEDFQI